jgi:ribonuclease T2
MRFLAALALALPPWASVAAAQVPLDGRFVAGSACPAYQSMRKGTNPGGVTTKPGATYDVLAINKAGGDHYRVRIPGAPVTEDRWVAVDCGRLAGDTATAASPSRESTDNLLALSWQPSFCETRPDTVECRTLNGGRLPDRERALSVHGLWPQPRDRTFCGVSQGNVATDQTGDWGDLPALDLSAETRARLERTMPGTASFLHRHEWTKHGTCYQAPGGAEEYFADTLNLADLVNGSAVGRFLAENAGRAVKTRDIRARFDATFGPGSGARVRVSCVEDGGRTLVSELFLALRGTIGPDPDLGALLAAARPQDPGCAEGILDRAGLQ